MIGTAKQIRRFMARVEIRPDGCWAWLGHRVRGYGRFEIKNAEQMTIATHRFAYLAFVGPIADDLPLDHLCRNTWCCNPEHVEPVTAEENLRRSDVALGIRSAATRCVHGHEFTPENTHIRRNGRRRCRECNRRRYKSVKGKTRNVRGYIYQEA